MQESTPCLKLSAYMWPGHMLAIVVWSCLSVGLQCNMPTFHLHSHVLCSSAIHLTHILRAPSLKISCHPLNSSGWLEIHHNLNVSTFLCVTNTYTCMHSTGRSFIQNLTLIHSTPIPSDHFVQAFSKKFHNTNKIVHTSCPTGFHLCLQACF